MDRPIGDQLKRKLFVDFLGTVFLLVAAVSLCELPNCLLNLACPIGHPSQRFRVFELE